MHLRRLVCAIDSTEELYRSRPRTSQSPSINMLTSSTISAICRALFKDMPFMQRRESWSENRTYSPQLQLFFIWLGHAINHCESRSIGRSRLLIEMDSGPHSMPGFKCYLKSFKYFECLLSSACSARWVCSFATILLIPFSQVSSIKSN